MKHKPISLFMSFVLALMFSITLSPALAQEGVPEEPADEPLTDVQAELEAKQVAEALANPPPEKPTLRVLETEVAQAASPPPNKSETEWNGGFGNADPIEPGDVMSGTIGRGEDIDFFVIEVPFAISLLFDIDAGVNGSYLDSVICLYDENQIEVLCNDDSDGLDSLLYYNGVPVPAYVSVRDYNYPYNGGAEFHYTLSVSEPWLVSSSKAGVVEGIRFENKDILAWQRFSSGAEKWSMFFDASNMGLKGDLEAIGHTADPTALSLALGTSQKIYIDGSYRPVKPHDVVEFVPNRYPGGWGGFGPNTAGSFNIYARGIDNCLTSSGEKIDALAGWGSQLESTIGRAKTCSGVKAQDEDLFYRTSGEGFFDGSLIGGLAREDIVAANYDVVTGTNFLSMTILGTGKICDRKVNQKQIFLITFEEWDFDTPYCGGVVWDGRDHNFNYPIDAIER